MQSENTRAGSSKVAFSCLSFNVTLTKLEVALGLVAFRGGDQNCPGEGGAKPQQIPGRAHASEHLAVDREPVFLIRGPVMKQLVCAEPDNL